MIVPAYWSEATTKKKINGKQFTLKRFGWSDVSEDDAKAHAERRLQEAIATLEAEGDVRRIDHKVAYNGAEGIPIREEVITRHDDVVISRNSYGALCLNTPNVMFADIDFAKEASFFAIMVSFLAILIAGLLGSAFIESWPVFFLGIFIAITFASSLANGVQHLVNALKGGNEAIAIKSIRKVAEENPEAHMRVYRTPMGLRVLMMHDIFDPSSDSAIKILKDLNSDPVYIQMCKNQQCFRARVSPKPWRIGLKRISSGKAVWPIKPERVKEREAWVREYEIKARDFAACHFREALGSQRSHPQAELVRKIHDELSRAENTSLKIA